MELETTGTILDSPAEYRSTTSFLSELFHVAWHTTFSRKSSKNDTKKIMGRDCYEDFGTVMGLGFLDSCFFSSGVLFSSFPMLAGDDAWGGHNVICVCRGRRKRKLHRASFFSFLFLFPSPSLFNTLVGWREYE